jgi:hypothetical protein
MRRTIVMSRSDLSRRFSPSTACFGNRGDQNRPSAHAERDLARFRAKEDTARLNKVVEIDQSQVAFERVGADVIFAQIDLELPVSVPQVREDGFAHVSLADDAPGDDDRFAVLGSGSGGHFQFRVAGEGLGRRVRATRARGVGIEAQRAEFLRFAAPLVLKIG